MYTPIQIVFAIEKKITSATCKRIIIAVTKFMSIQIGRLMRTQIV